MIIFSALSPDRVRQIAELSVMYFESVREITEARSAPGLDSAGPYGELKRARIQQLDSDIWILHVMIDEAIDEVRT